MTQPELPLSGHYQCEKCYCSVDFLTLTKSRERYDNHTLCFKHQLEYKKWQMRQKRLHRAEPNPVTA